MPEHSFSLAKKVGFYISLSGALILCLVVVPILATPKPAKAQGFWGYNYSYAKKRKRVRRYRKRRSQRRYRRSTKRKYSEPKKAAWTANKSKEGPLQLVVSLPEQRITVYDGDQPVVSSRISTGRPGYRTPSGVFSILQKHRHHYSNLYGGAPMPHMQRITWSGVALHGGPVPNHPASHGCIRLPYRFAGQLFKYTEMGAHVIVANEHGNAPIEFSHENLFQPMPPKEDEDSELKQADTESVDSDTQAVGDEQVQELPQDEIESQITQTAKVGDDGSAEKSEQTLSKKELAKLRRERAREKRELAKKKQIERKQRLASSAIGAGGDQIAKPKSQSPIRILITRRTERERIMDIQRKLEFLGYYPGPADGYVGKDTIAAIKKFRYEFMMPKGSVIDDELVQRIYKAVNEDEVQTGHLYIRQDQIDIFNAPISITHPDKPLGTHLFTASYFDKGAKNTKWYAMSLKDKVTRHKRRRSRKSRTHPKEFETAIPGQVITASAALDRVKIPEKIKTKISEMLTPGSSLAITDKGLGRETGKGTDFVVLTQ